MPGEFPYDVFLSHSAKDKPVVRDVAERLRKDGLRVWFDEWEIRPGDSIPAKIEEGLERSRVLVLCMSAHAFGSDWAQLESGTFRFRDPLNKERRFLPLRLEGKGFSGQLNPEFGGPGVFPPIPKEITVGAKGGWPQNDRVRDYSRRSIYIFARRNLRFPFLEVFDAPDNNLGCPARERSTTAPQSLTLLNADEVTIAAKLTGARLMKEAASTDERITLAYRLILGRPPSAKEQDIARAFLTQSPLHEFCRALFNLNDFVYAE